MLGKPKKKKSTKVDSLIGQNSRVVGDIHFSGGLHIDGTIEGNIVAENDGSSVLTLSDRGTIEGEVTVPYVVLNGLIKGNVHASQHVELATNARIEGDVHYALIEMAMGAEVNGKLVRKAEQEREPLAIGHETSKVLDKS